MRKENALSKITVTVQIDAPAEKVWETIADFGGISNWAPNVLSSYSTTPNNGGVDAARHCEVAGFGGVDERIIDWEDRSGYTFIVENIGPVRRVFSTWAVSAQDDRATVTTSLDISMKFGLFGAAIYQLVARRNFLKAIAVGQSGLKQYVESN